MNPDILNPPAAHGLPLFNAVLKARAQDFQVDEVLALDFAGSGEHLYLRLEKTSMNTDELSTLLQQAYGVTSADIGFCGLKDRHSVSTQWFSVRTPQSASVMEQLALTYNEQQKAQWGDDSGYLKAIQVVGSERHSRKLKRGAHQGNRFVITLRDVQRRDVQRSASPAGASMAGESVGISAAGTSLMDISSVDTSLVGTSLANALAERVELIRVHGFPAYIGSQRFGHGAQNLRRAQQWFGKSSKRTSRQQRSLWLSAARSALFNVICAARVRDGSWLHLMTGEPAMLDGTGSYFIANVDDDNVEDGVADGHSGDLGKSDLSESESGKSDLGKSDSSESEAGKSVAGKSESDISDAGKSGSDTSLVQRLASHDIHPTAPWWGRGRAPAKEECANYEDALLAPFSDLCAGLERAGLAQERRALRGVAQDLSIEWVSDTAIELRFSLAPGIFATSLLRELGTCTEPVRNVA